MVKEWENSPKVVHAITDSVSHNIPLMGGMIGLTKHVKDKFPTIQKMDIQLSYDNCIKLLEKYNNKQISDTLIAMENYKPLLSKSKNVYLTLLTWLRKDEKQEPKIVMPYEKRNQQ